MRLLRTLGLLLIACGLFVQTAAHATASPQDFASVEAGCADMDMAGETAGTSNHDGSPCKNLRLDCLVALGCIAPLAPVDDTALVGENLATPSQFSGSISYSLSGTGLGPEPPPPQLSF